MKKYMVYRLLTMLLWPVFFIYTIKIALRDKSSRYFFQRLGFSYPRYKSTIWIHCASVGEVNTYTPLHLKLLEKHPQTQFIITTNTITGGNTVKHKKFARTSHYYLPVESGFAIKRFLNACRPSQCLIMETEIWPLLYQLCYKKDISVSIINARLTHKTLSANHWIKSLYKTSLAQVNKILCKSAAELKNFMTLGANDSQLLVAGNLKFTHANNTHNIQPLKLNNRSYIVAASTHSNEEQQLAKLWKKIDTQLLLVIVPRHPNRSNQIQKQLNTLDINYAIRSQNEKIDELTQIYLADTLGELTQLMAGSEFVFIGGSLIAHGGQNILEAARLGKATVCGSSMFNFKDELELLLRQNACIQIDNTEQLKNTFTDLLSQPEKYRLMGDRAQSALAQQQGILEYYITQLGE